MKPVYRPRLEVLESRQCPAGLADAKALVWHGLAPQPPPGWASDGSEALVIDARLPVQEAKQPARAARLAQVQAGLGQAGADIKAEIALATGTADGDAQGAAAYFRALRAVAQSELDYCRGQLAESKAASAAYHARLLRALDDPTKTDKLRFHLWKQEVATGARAAVFAREVRLLSKALAQADDVRMARAVFQAITRMQKQAATLKAGASSFDGQLRAAQQGGQPQVIQDTLYVGWVGFNEAGVTLRLLADLLKDKVNAIPH
jgi:hypothetical protein